MSRSLQSPVAEKNAGAAVRPDGVSYRVWAPDHPRVTVEIESRSHDRARRLELETHDGYWCGHDPDGRAGDLYHFQLTDGNLYPDVASHFQPRGVHGPSECIDPAAYRWRCASWQRPRWTGQSIYELHVGTFTPEGTFVAAIEKLAHVRDLGVEAIELMPVADFPGRWGWSYEGVALYAPARCYGRPDDLRALVDAAHQLGLSVILDVVYNHLGPSGNYLPTYCRDYFHPANITPWGAALNLDGPRSGPVRDFLVGNAVYWLDEFRIDGLRLDATHAMPDSSEIHLLAEIASAVHARGGFVIAEDERNAAELLGPPTQVGFQFDAVWSDDFHHETRVALTGIREAYFASYRGTTPALVETLAHGWSYRGQNFPFWKNRPRGSACGHLPTSAFVYCLENHDQVGNRAQGERLEHLIAPEAFRAASMLLCLSPYPPLIFMGQEWAASTPFLFFTDHEEELGRLVSDGRRREFESNSSFHDAAKVPDPQDPATFAQSKLRWAECAEPSHAATLALYRTCLRQRQAWRRAGVFDRAHWRVETAGEIIALRYAGIDDAWLLLVSLSAASGAPDLSVPRLRPPEGKMWRPLIHSEDPRFGGAATDADLNAGSWQFDRPGAVLLKAEVASCR